MPVSVNLSPGLRSKALSSIRTLRAMRGSLGKNALARYCPPTFTGGHRKHLLIARSAIRILCRDMREFHVGHSLPGKGRFQHGWTTPACRFPKPVLTQYVSRRLSWVSRSYPGRSPHIHEFLRRECQRVPDLTLDPLFKEFLELLVVQNRCVPVHNVLPAFERLAVDGGLELFNVLSFQ